MRNAAFSFIEVYYNRSRIQKALGYLLPAEYMRLDLTKECQKRHNRSVYEIGRPPYRWVLKL